MSEKAQRVYKKEQITLWNLEQEVTLVIAKGTYTSKVYTCDFCHLSYLSWKFVSVVREYSRCFQSRFDVNEWLRLDAVLCGTLF